MVNGMEIDTDKIRKQHEGCAVGKQHKLLPKEISDFITTRIVSQCMMCVDQ